MIDVRDYLERKGHRVRSAGPDNIHANCPFCNEDPGSRGRLYIYVGPDEEMVGVHMCHLCGTKGNLRTLLRHFGDDLPKDDREREGPQFQAAIQQTAANFYKACLTEEALEFLRKERGLTDETIERYGLGWADDIENSLFHHLRERNFTIEDIRASGLVVERGGNLVDFFKNRIIIPYYVNGHVVLIRGKEIGGKYFTPPGAKTRLFSTDSAWTSDEVVLCEGEFDAMVLSQMGFTTVASPGANVWQDAWNGYFEDTLLYVMFDPDESGRKGAEKVKERMGSKARVVELPVPEGSASKDIDPSSLVVEHGWKKEDFEATMRAALKAGSLLISVQEAFEEWESVQGLDGLKLGYELLDLAIRPGLLPAQVMVVLAKTNTGKQEPISALIPTFSGYKKMGDIQVGDEVFGSDGQPTKVTGVFPQGVKPVYRLTFSDHTTAEAGDEHLWKVAYRYGKRREWKWEVKSTQELMDAGLRHNKEYKFIIPMTEPVAYPEADLPIDPYVLGTVIANGNATGGQVRIVTPDDDVAAKVLSRWSGNRHHRPEGACSAYGLYKMMGPIRELGLDVKSRDKFIPEPYLLGSIEQRIELLQGLMDGDGTPVKSQPNSVAYSTTSRRLAEDVKELVSSLGGTASPNWFDRSTESKPDECCISIMMPDGISAFSSKRKKNTNSVQGRYKRIPRRAITNIEYVRDEESQCISVAAPDHLYLTGRNYVVTHNTIMLLNLFHRLSMLQPDAKILFVSLEQTRGDWFERARRIWNLYNLDCDPSKVNRSTIEYWAPRLMLMDKNRIGEDELVSCIDEYEAFTGGRPDLVAIDYLGYWASGFKGRDRYEKVSDAVMALKSIAKEKRIAIIAPHQVNRTAQFGVKPDVDQARDSGAVEETADFVLSLWNPDNQKDRAPEERTGQVNLEVGKSRHGGKGVIVKMQFAPLTLAITPLEDPLSRLCRDELDYVARKDLWEQAVVRHRTGNKDLHVPPRMGSDEPVQHFSEPYRPGS